MSDATRSGLEAPDNSLSAGSTTDPTPSKKPDKVYLVSYPKIIFLYPSVLTSMFCAVFMWVKGGVPETIPVPAATSVEAADSSELTGAGTAADPQTETPGTADVDPSAEPVRGADAPATDELPTVKDAQGPTFHYVCARVFLLVLLINLVVIAFDFPRTTSLTWFFAFVAISIGIWTLFRLNAGLAPKVLHSLLSVQPVANSSFYFIYTAGMLFLYFCVLVSRRFDYWEVRGNELLHHHGFLSDLERFHAPNLRIDKEINDVFEYLLLRSGRLILHPSNERRAIVLENVLSISDKEDRITQMLGALQVRVRTETE